VFSLLDEGNVHLMEQDSVAMANGQHNLVSSINLLKPTGHVKHQQFNIQQLYVLPTLYLCVLYLSEKKATCATYIVN
jgi:hypothetical protein